MVHMKHVQCRRCAQYTLSSEEKSSIYSFHSCAEFLQASDIFDVWEKLGSREATKWTWNRRVNCNYDDCDNQDASLDNRLRSDRMYCWRGGDAPVEVRTLELTGEEVIDPNKLNCLPSDHFGLFVNLVVG
eukprot:Gregarina_sp_Pseudo_9__2263@NODE_2595_length_942_cov_44_189369_g2379_i0_p1_GENE_NODE_2595_length_942_cov_44_189369_g2379_i0NODE_2595_length_942_cov_44_189369_g2379_i0_p1_ORF_typecomplete_len130_score3_50_NODE_2595_length_942_cov_44_189369_g2379_i0517906